MHTCTYVHTGVYNICMCVYIYINGCIACKHVGLCVCVYILNCPTHLKSGIQDYSRQIVCSPLPGLHPDPVSEGLNIFMVKKRGINTAKGSSRTVYIPTIRSSILYHHRLLMCPLSFVFLPEEEEWVNKVERQILAFSLGVSMYGQQ